MVIRPFTCAIQSEIVAASTMLKSLNVLAQWEFTHSYLTHCIDLNQVIFIAPKLLNPRHLAPSNLTSHQKVHIIIIIASFNFLYNPTI